MDDGPYAMIRDDYLPDIVTPICVVFIGDVLACIARSNDWLYVENGVKVTSMFYVEARNSFYIYFD